MTGIAGVQLEARAVIAAVKLTKSVWVCAVEIATASALGGMIIPALRLLVVSGIFIFFEKKWLTDGRKVDGRTVGGQTNGWQTDGQKMVNGRTDGRLTDRRPDG